MDTQTRMELERELRRRRDELLRDVSGVSADLRIIEEDRESELEERAQEQQQARSLDSLEEHDRREIEEIDRALRRMADGSYGNCAECGEPIEIERLRAVPTALRCIECVRGK